MVDTCAVFFSFLFYRQNLLTDIFYVYILLFIIYIWVVKYLRLIHDCRTVGVTCAWFFTHPKVFPATISNQQKSFRFLTSSYQPELIIPQQHVHMCTFVDCLNKTHLKKKQYNIFANFNTICRLRSHTYIVGKTQ